MISFFTEAKVPWNKVEIKRYFIMLGGGLKQ